MRFVEGLRGSDVELNRLVEENKKHYAGLELPQRTLGILGLGRIGSLVADAAIKLGMNVMGYDPEITVEAAWSLPSQVRRAHSIEEVLKACDFLTLHVPLVPATQHLIDARRLALMRHGAVLLNFARDEIVDAEAVVEALKAKRLKYYVCDFPNPRFDANPGVVALPHLGASTREAEDNCAVMVANQVRDYLEHGNIRNAVNFPDVVMERESPYRVGIANANVPNMLGQISTAVASRRAQHSQHAEQIQARDGLHRGGRRQRGARGPCCAGSPPSRACLWCVTFPPASNSHDRSAQAVARPHRCHR